jgi:hypothetical protein
MSWHDGFGVYHGTKRNFHRELWVMQYPDSKVERHGKKLQWALEWIELAEDGKTVLHRGRPTFFETKEQAEAAGWAEGKEIKKVFAAQTKAAAHKPTANEQDLFKARLIVMREQYPDTLRAMDALPIARSADRPARIEALFRAYALDMVRLHKPENLGDILPFKSTPDDMSFILKIAKAYKAQSPRDPVDVEIAARWFAAGYDKMSLAEYTNAINAKTGAKLKPDAMEKRRYSKLGLMTKRPPGPAPKS